MYPRKAISCVKDSFLSRIGPKQLYTLYTVYTVMKGLIMQGVASCVFGYETLLGEDVF